MLANNPMHNPDVRQRATATIRAMMKSGDLTPFGRGAGGKGTSGTPSEAKAWALLRPIGFEREISIPVGQRWHQKTGVRYYTADFLHRYTLVVVEIDGSSHQSSVRKEKDRIRDRILMSLGYSVLRFPATFEPSELLAKVQRALSTST